MILVYTKLVALRMISRTVGILKYRKKYLLLETVLKMCCGIVKVNGNPLRYRTLDSAC